MSSIQHYASCPPYSIMLYVFHTALCFMSPIQHYAMFLPYSTMLYVPHTALCYVSPIQDYAICVCIVMDYYHLGDMDRVLRQRRDKKTPLEDHVMKKWIGQLIEALQYVHGQDMIHRYTLEEAHIKTFSTLLQTLTTPIC